jgi:hypothetical protein
MKWKKMIGPVVIVAYISCWIVWPEIGDQIAKSVSAQYHSIVESQEEETGITGRFKLAMVQEPITDWEKPAQVRTILSFISDSGVRYDNLKLSKSTIEAVDGVFTPSGIDMMGILTKEGPVFPIHELAGIKGDFLYRIYGDYVDVYVTQNSSRDFVIRKIKVIYKK